MNTPRYYAFLLRIWQVADPEEPQLAAHPSACWRASLEDPHTRHVTGFDSLQALYAHLERITTTGSPENG